MAAAHGFVGRNTDWLVLNATGTCLNHDLRFGTCGDASGWTVSAERVQLGEKCIASGGLRGGLALVPCSARDTGGLLGARSGRLCSGAQCERCAAAQTSIAGASHRDRCAYVLPMAARRWGALLAAMLLVMYGAGAGVLLWLSGAVGRRVPTAEALGIARTIIADLRKEPKTHAADCALREHALGVQAGAGFLHLDSYRTFLLDKFQLEQASARAMRMLASRCELRSAGRPFFAARAGEEAEMLQQIAVLGAAIGLERAQLDRYEMLPESQALAGQLSLMASSLPPSATAAALALSRGALGTLCQKLSSALELHFALSRNALVFLDRRADANCNRAFETAALHVMGDDLHSGVSQLDIEIAARLLLDLELASCDAIYGAFPLLPEPLLRGSEGRVSLADGASLHYTDAGPRTGQVLLLLHGWPDSLHSWRVLSPLLHPSLRVISVSLRGFGDSWPHAAPAADGAKPAQTKQHGGWGRKRTVSQTSTSIEKVLAVPALAADIRVLLAGLGIRRLSIAGYSLGALVARALAANVFAETADTKATSLPMPPLVVDWLFLMASAPVGEKNHVAQKLLPLFADSSLQIDEQFVKVWQGRVLHKPAAMPGWFRNTVLQESLKLPKNVWLAGLSAMATDDHLVALTAVKARTLILLGTEDRLNPRVDAEQLQARIPSCELREIKHAGCVPHWDAPEAVAREINNALVPASRVASL